MSALLLVLMRLQTISGFAFPSPQMEGCVRGPSVLPGTLSVVHVVHGVPVNLPREVDGDEAENQPAEQDLEYGHSHVVGEPVVHELGEERQAAVSDAGQELKVPGFLHRVRVSSS